MRPSLPHNVRTRLETSRVVIYSLIAGVLVGALGVGLRAALDFGGEWLGRVVGFRPPGTPGEGGLLQAFGSFGPPEGAVGLAAILAGLPWGLLVLPLFAALSVLARDRAADPLEEAIHAYHADPREASPGLRRRLQELGAALLGYFSSLPVGRDAPFAALGNLGAALLGRLARVNPAEARTLALACVAAALGMVLHAPLAAAVLVVEVLYRRFEFEVEALLPAVLASVAAYAVYGAAHGFSPLVAPGVLQTPTLAQVPIYALLGLAVSLGAWLVTGARTLLPPPASLRLSPALLAVGLGLVAAAIAWRAPEVLGDGTGWWQLTLQGFQGEEAGLQGLARLALLLAVAWLGLGGTLLSSLSVGGLLGAGLAGALPSLALDPAVGGLVGAAAFLTTSHGVPVAATLLLASWGGDALLPALLSATMLAHGITGEANLLRAPVRGRLNSPAHDAPPVFVPAAPPPDPALAAVAPDVPPPQGDEQLYRVPLPGPWTGLPTAEVLWPRGVQFVAVLRDGEVQLVRPGQVFARGDEIMLLASPDSFQGFAQTLSGLRGN